MNAIEEFLNKNKSYYLSVFRIVTAFLFFQYGSTLLWGIPSSPDLSPVDSLSFPSGISGVFCIVLGALLMLGLFTRTSAFLASGQMFIAYIMGHVLEDPSTIITPLVNDGVVSVLFCFIFLLFVFYGSGPISIDRLIKKSKIKNIEPR